MTVCPVKTLQDPQELEAVLLMYRKLKPKRVLEIGSLYGGTLWHWIMKAYPGTVIVSVDKIPDNKDHKASVVLEEHKLWAGWAETAQVELIEIIGNSNDIEVVNWVKEYQPFDFIFVDGGHDYETVSADYQNYYPMLNKGGLMAFHDIATPDVNAYEIDVGRWWRDMTAAKMFDGKVMESITRPGKWGIGIIKK